MYFETFEKLKIYAAIHPDKIQTVTKKDLDDIEPKESGVNKNGTVHDCNVIYTTDSSMSV